MLRGLLAATTVICYYSSIESLPLPVAVGLFFFNPVFCLMLDAAVADRHVPPAAIASCLLTVLGVLAIGWHDQILWLLEQVVPQLQQLPQLQPAAGAAGMGAAAGAFPAADLPLEGVLFGLAAAAANAAAFVCVGVIGPRVSPLCLTWWQHLVVTHVAVAAIFLRNLEPLEFRVSSSSFGGELGSLFGALGSSTSSISSSISSTGAAGTGWSSMWYDVICGLALDASDALADLADALPSRHDGLLLAGVVGANFCGQLLLNLGFQRVDAGRGAAINTSQVRGCVVDVTFMEWFIPHTVCIWLLFSLGFQRVDAGRGAAINTSQVRGLWLLLRLWSGVHHTQCVSCLWT
jgi:drug/metabolite transporter (DMT)-like permease